MALISGTRIGPYEIASPLGRGGMGEVYRARDARLDRDVALKVLPADVAGDPDRRARFEREAKAVAALSHPNILAIFDFGVVDGVAYAVTELLPGKTLREYIGAPLPVRKATDVAIQIARGLSAAHAKGIVHRDLKPENIFVLDDGQVKILDFGLAKTADGRESADETRVLTDAGTLLGTVGYMAPEQVRGEPVDGRADLFALGAVLYEMLAGRRAFQRDTAAETMSAILRDDPPDLSASRADLPPALDGIVCHCLERNPAERFQSARDLVFSLQAVAHASGTATPAAAASTHRTSRRMRISAHEAVAWVIVAALAAVAIPVFLTSRERASDRLSGVRFAVMPPEKMVFGFPLGAPEGSNSGAISPDGRMLAFVAAEPNGRPLLWIRALDSFAARALPGTEGAAFPFWSPDSRFVAFFTIGRLRKVPAEGGPVETVTEVASTARGGTWSRDGVILLASAGSAVYRVAANGGTPTPVTKPDTENSGHQWPSFLPDGQHFLFYASSSRALYVASLDGGHPKRITHSDTNGIFVAPSQILFMREGSLVTQDIDLARFELTGEPRVVAQHVSWSVAPWNLGAFSASTNGILTYRPGGGNRTQLTWFDRAGRVLGTLGPPGDYLAPALSPDGTRVAFTRRDDDPAGDIWTIDVPTQTMSRLTLSAATDIYPVWTPDGSMVVYESTQDGLLARSVSSTAAPRRLLTFPSLLIPSQVSTDGKLLILFADIGEATGFDVFALPLTGDAKLTPIVRSPVSDVEPQLSPDGRWLASVSTETGSYQTVIQQFPSGAERRPIPVAGGRQPMWRRDGRELFLVTGERQFYAVEIRPSGTALEFGEPRFLFEMPANTVSVRNSYAVSADGRRFLVNKLVDSAARAQAINVVFSQQRGAQ